MAPKPLYVINWTRLTPSKRSYYIRGIDSNGRFYGEIRYFLPAGGEFANTTGQLTAEELATVMELAERIRGRSEPSSSINSTYRGVLADGPISHAATSDEAIIYRASIEASDSPSGRDFTRITEIIGRHISQ